MCLRCELRMFKMLQTMDVVKRPGEVVGIQDWFSGEHYRKERKHNFYIYPFEQYFYNLNAPDKLPSLPQKRNSRVSSDEFLGTFRSIGNFPWKCSKENNKEIDSSVRPSTEDLKQLIPKDIEYIHARLKQGRPIEEIALNERNPSSNKSSSICQKNSEAFRRLIFDIDKEAVCDVFRVKKIRTPRTLSKRWPRRKKLTVNKDLSIHQLMDVSCKQAFNLLCKSRESNSTRPQTVVIGGNKGGSQVKEEKEIDKMLTQEMHEEELDWVTYDEDEAWVKIQLTDSIFDILINDTVKLLSSMQCKRPGHSPTR